MCTRTLHVLQPEQPFFLGLMQILAQDELDVRAARKAAARNAALLAREAALKTSRAPKLRKVTNAHLMGTQ